jgi:uncharacterized protein (TIGR02145 family)
MFQKKIFLYILIVFPSIPSYILHGKNPPLSQDLTLVVLKVKPGISTGTFTDKRDNKIYRQVKIGNQTWMAENLNYGKLTLNMKQEDNYMAEKSFYKNDTVIGKKMGGLYTWEEATNHVQNTNEKIIQGLCPDGWHLPSDEEWETLTNILDPEVGKKNEGWSGKTIAFLLVDSSATKTKFNLKFAGNAVSNWFFYLDEMGYFWTSSKYSASSAWCRTLSKDSKQIYRGPGDIKLGMSIRCIKD